MLAPTHWVDTTHFLPPSTKGCKALTQGSPGFADLAKVCKAGWCGASRLGPAWSLTDPGGYPGPEAVSQAAPTATGPGGYGAESPGFGPPCLPLEISLLFFPFSWSGLLGQGHSTVPSINPGTGPGPRLPASGILTNEIRAQGPCSGTPSLSFPVTMSLQQGRAS